MCYDCMLTGHKKQLGIPTANIPVEGVQWIDAAESGVYYGYAGIHIASTSTTTSTSASSTPSPSATWHQYPMVMSIGYNPFYNNKTRSAEVHVLHDFSSDFYGADMALTLLGFIRKELDYVSVESLIEDINVDIAVTRRCLTRETYARFMGEGWLKGAEGPGSFL